MDIPTYRYNFRFLFRIIVISSEFFEVHFKQIICVINNGCFLNNLNKRKNKIYFSMTKSQNKKGQVNLKKNLKQI